jgi:hypothetical protein
VHEIRSEAEVVIGHQVVEVNIGCPQAIPHQGCESATSPYLVGACGKSHRYQSARSMNPCIWRSKRVRAVASIMS